MVGLSVDISCFLGNSLGTIIIEATTKIKTIPTMIISFLFSFSLKKIIVTLIQRESYYYYL